MDADANAGLAPTDPGWVDTREGSFYWDVTQVCALEIARLWDAVGSETVAAAFPSVAWGPYLDEHATTFGLTRNIAVAATGRVQFTGGPVLLVPTGTLVAAPPSDPSLDAVTFATTASGTTGPLVLAPTGITATPTATGGSLATATYIYRVTSYTQFGESLPATDVSAVVTGPTGKVTLAWSAVTGALGYRVYRTVAVGTPAAMIADLNSLSLVDGGGVTPGAVQPTQNTTPGVDLPASAVIPGTAGDLAPGALTTMATVIPGIAGVTNAAATLGGTDVENDEQLRARVLAQYVGQGAGNQNDYVRWALAAVGVERAVCVPIWNGPGTVLVVPMKFDGTPVIAAIVTALQTQLDPIPGQGHGLAPIGATVTVATSSVLSVTVVGTVAHGTGYSLDGASGTIATRASIVAALTAYLVSLNPGDIIRYQQVQAAIVSAEGVATVSALTVNGGVADITLTLTPAQVASLAAATLS